MLAPTREFSLNDPDAAALIVDLLSQGGVVQFRGHGSSMLPFLRDGDLLTAEPVNPPVLRRGDIVLYRGAGGKLIVHRIVRKRARDAGAWLDIRGDALLRADRYVSGSQVLGRIVGVQRQTSVRMSAVGGSAFVPRLWLLIFPLGPIALGFLGLVKRLAGKILRGMQRFPLYRRVVRHLLKPRISIRTATANDVAALNRLYGNSYVKSMGFSPQGAWLASDRAGYFLVAEWLTSIIGAVVVLNEGTDESHRQTQWVFGLLVRQPFRGAGIGEMLMQAVCQRADQEGISELRLQVFEDNAPAMWLYKKMGFHILRAQQQSAAEGAAARTLLVLTRPIRNGPPT